MYRESLPNDCPPIDAYEIEGELIVFRLVSSPVVEGDFDSHVKKKPHVAYKDMCAFGSLSVETDQAVAVRRLMLPSFFGMRVGRLALTTGAGRIMADCEGASHHSWWPYAGFPILECCEVLE